MPLSIIVAMDVNGVIGLDNGIPWRLSADMKHVKSTTIGHPIIMGRKTHESIGKPLPGRENIIITRDTDYQSEGCTVLHSLEQAINHCEDNDEAFILGGAEIYNQALPFVSRIFLTEVHTSVAGDTFFPIIDFSDWHEASRQHYSADEKNEYDYSFVTLEK
jgi:dihydrofolate reductase